MLAAVRTMQRGVTAGVFGAARVKAPLLSTCAAAPSGSAAMAHRFSKLAQQPFALSPCASPGSIALPLNVFALGGGSARTFVASRAASYSRAPRTAAASLLLPGTGIAARRALGSTVSLPTLSIPTAMLFSSMRLANVFQPHASALVRRSASRLVPARHHAAAYRKQFLHSNHYRRRPKPISGDTVVLGLIAANVLVTMMWLTAHSQRKKRRMLSYFTTSTLHLARGQYYTLLTSMFSHADAGHLLANMIGLYFFGRQMCDVLGPKRFLGIYLASGVLSSWAAVYEQQFANRMSFNLGASGAVNSITAMSILLFPYSTLLIFGIVPLPAWVAGSMFIFKDAYSWATDRRDGIGHFAHLSGAFCGAAYYYYLRRVGTFRRF